MVKANASAKSILELLRLIITGIQYCYYFQVSHLFVSLFHNKRTHGYVRKVNEKKKNGTNEAYKIILVPSEQQTTELKVIILRR